VKEKRNRRGRGDRERKGGKPGAVFRSRGKKSTGSEEEKKKNNTTHTKHWAKQKKKGTGVTNSTLKWGLAYRQLEERKKENSSKNQKNGEEKR